MNGVGEPASVETGRLESLPIHAHPLEACRGTRKIKSRVSTDGAASVRHRTNQVAKPDHRVFPGDSASIAWSGANDATRETSVHLRNLRRAVASRVLQEGVDIAAAPPYGARAQRDRLRKRALFHSLIDRRAGNAALSFDLAAAEDLQGIIGHAGSEQTLRNTPEHEANFKIGIYADQGFF